MAFYLAALLSLLGWVQSYTHLGAAEPTSFTCLCEHCQASCQCAALQDGQCLCSIEDATASEVYVRPANNQPAPAALPKAAAIPFAHFVHKTIIQPPAHLLCQRDAWQRLPDELLL